MPPHPGRDHVGHEDRVALVAEQQVVVPYTYLVDVLQRMDSRPAKDVAALTPRLWKDRFAAEPPRTAIDLPAYDAAR